jgi:hypothetical protein
MVFFWLGFGFARRVYWTIRDFVFCGDTIHISPSFYLPVCNNIVSHVLHECQSATTSTSVSMNACHAAFQPTIEFSIFGVIPVRPRDTVAHTIDRTAKRHRTLSTKQYGTVVCSSSKLQDVHLTSLISSGTAVMHARSRFSADPPPMKCTLNKLSIEARDGLAAGSHRLTETRPAMPGRFLGFRSTISNRASFDDLRCLGVCEAW